MSNCLRVTSPRVSSSHASSHPRSSSDEDQVAVRTSGRVRRQDAPKSRAPVPPVRTSRGKNWTTVEEYLLRRVVESYAGEGIDWSAVDLKVGRTSCQARWKVIQKRSESSRPRPGPSLAQPRSLFRELMPPPCSQDSITPGGNLVTGNSLGDLSRDPRETSTMM